MDALAELESRLRRYPAERYPVQRATALFHLGLVVTATDASRAQELLAESAALFARAGLAVEEAKARNALGAALREAGRPSDAAAAFRAAADAFERAGLAAERGAALYNLALVDDADAVALLGAARDAFASAELPREQAAAARELGARLLRDGDVERAVAALEEALELARDDAALGAAANAVGLAYLAAGRADDAVDALRRAAAASPRTIRPHEHAMAKANLALAYERAGEPRRARLAAAQALGVPAAPAPVREQAEATLARLGPAAGDLVAVLAEEPRDRWPPLVREEVARWIDADDASLEAEAHALAAALDAALAEALLAALLELPPEPMERVLAAVLAAGGAPAREELERAAALFHAPQELRVREVVARLEERRSSSAT